MAANAMALSSPGLRFWVTRVRGWFSGVGYVALISSALVVLWSLRETVGVIAQSGDVMAIVHTFATTAMELSRIVLLPVPVIALILNLAPRHGLSRGIFLAALALLMALWCSGPALLQSAGDSAALGEFAESLLTASLLVAAFSYRGSSRIATDALRRQKLEGEILDAQAKQARLQLLRAQIEPHFLFNTLATVRTLARIDRPAAVKMIDNLVRYLGEALPRLRQDESALGDELRLVDAYLRIHQVRMGTRLEYEITDPGDLAGERVPTMMLLTLVENALKHGINPLVEGGFIRVSATCERATLVLKVADSGRGLTTEHGHGAGLANVRLRLTMLYGERAILSLARAQSRGVVATVSIPTGVRS
jgi:sensor histidine kinase YesM